MDMEQRANWRVKRLDKRITLTEIAKAVGCTHALFSIFENGGNISKEKIEQYVDYIESHKNKQKSIQRVIRR